MQHFMFHTFFLPLSSMLQYEMTMESILIDLVHIQEFHCERTHTKTLLALTFSVRWVYSICALLAHLHTFAIRFLRRMLSKQTLFASNADKQWLMMMPAHVNGDDRMLLQKEVSAYAKTFLILATCSLHTQHICASARSSFLPLPPAPLVLSGIVVIRIVVWRLKTDRVTFTSRALLPSL